MFLFALRLTTGLATASDDLATPVVYLGEHLLVREVPEEPGNHWGWFSVEKAPVGEFKALTFECDLPSGVYSLPFCGAESEFEVRPARAHIPSIPAPVLLGFVATLLPNPYPGGLGDDPPLPALVLSIALPDGGGTAWTVTADNLVDAMPQGEVAIASGENVDIHLWYREGDTVCTRLTLRDPSLTVRWQQRYSCVRPDDLAPDHRYPLAPDLDLAYRLRAAAAGLGALFVLLLATVFRGSL